MPTSLHTSSRLEDTLHGLTPPHKLLSRSMRIDCFWPLCPLSPCSTSIPYCLRWLTRQLDSRRSRPTQLRCYSSTPTSSPTLTFDPSREISKGEGYEDRASEDDGMGGDLIYPTPPPQSNTHYPTANAMQPFYHQVQPYPTPQFLPPSPGLGFNAYPYPMANGFYPYPPPLAPALAPAPSPSDKKGNRQKGNKKDKKDKTPPKAKTGTPNTNLPRTSLSRPSRLHFYCPFHG